MNVDLVLAALGWLLLVAVLIRRELERRLDHAGAGDWWTDGADCRHVSARLRTVHAAAGSGSFAGDRDGRGTGVDLLSQASPRLDQGASSLHRTDRIHVLTATILPMSHRASRIVRVTVRLSRSHCQRCCWGRPIRSFRDRSPRLASRWSRSGARLISVGFSITSVGPSSTGAIVGASVVVGVSSGSRVAVGTTTGLPGSPDVSK